MHTYVQKYIVKQSTILSSHMQITTSHIFCEYGQVFTSYSIIFQLPVLYYYIVINIINKSSLHSRSQDLFILHNYISLPILYPTHTLDKRTDSDSMCLNFFPLDSPFRGYRAETFPPVLPYLAQQMSQCCNINKFKFCKYILNLFQKQNRQQSAQNF